MWRTPSDKSDVHTSDFLFGIYWWIWKATIYSKNCWSGPLKNVRISLFTILYLKKNTWRYHHFTLVYQKFWWYDLQFLRYRLQKTEIGNYGSLIAFLHPPLPPLKTQKMWILKTKKIAGDIIIFSREFYSLFW